MLVYRPYDRPRAAEYARKWVFSQNPLFGDFRTMGGNCTNFVSQCILAGSCQMNYLPTFGWYYRSLDDRTASWSGVTYFYNFITANAGVGPFGIETGADSCEIGDVIQLGREGSGFYHTLLIVGFDGEDPLVAAQTDDAIDRPLSSYTYDYERRIKILGVRFSWEPPADCFPALLDGTALPAT